MKTYGNIELRTYGNQNFKTF